MKLPQLIVFAGLSGTGKSSLAEAVGRVLGIPVFAADISAAALRSLSTSRGNTTPKGSTGS